MKTKTAFRMKDSTVCVIGALRIERPRQICDAITLGTSQFDPTYTNIDASVLLPITGHN